MKSKLSVLLCIVFLIISLAGCGNNNLPQIEQYPDDYFDNPANDDTTGGDNGQTQPVQQQNFYTGQQYIDSIATTHSPYTRKYAVENGNLVLSGSFADDMHKYVLIYVNGDAKKETFKVNNRSYSGVIDLTGISYPAVINIYGGPEEYGNFDGIVSDFIKLDSDNGELKFFNSPVYDNNVNIYLKPKDMNAAVAADDRIQSDNSSIIKLSNDITKGISNDYDKVKAIHDWVAENIYYDYDALAAGDYSNLDAVSMLINKKGVCEGYSNLFAALVRVQGIPCVKQGGYALGVGEDKEWNSRNLNISESNHAWNEVYVDGRWIIVDSTWDSQNTYQYGKFTKGKFVNDIYFDATMEFFSLSHRSMEE